MLQNSININVGIPEQLAMQGSIEVIEDGMALTRGIILGSLLSVPIWLILSLSTYALLH
jgi:hypothetical protein